MPQESRALPPGRRIAVTGTQRLTPSAQGFVEAVILALLQDTHVITGTCIGVDTVVAHTAFMRGLYVTAIVPAKREKVDPEWRAYCTDFYEMPDGDPEPYRRRNEEVVRRGDILAGFPTFPEKHSRSIRSGTWMTVRIARQAGKPVYLWLLSELSLTASMPIVLPWEEEG